MNGPVCVKCTRNTVKSTADDGTSCPTDCDGMTKVPNSGHTACGKKKNTSDIGCCQQR